MTDKERFEKKIDKSGDCWEWTASKTEGYGKFKLNGKSQSAHRVAYKLAHPEWNGELCVCHHCDNPGCVNPGHLFVGTKAENNADKIAKGRASAKLTEQQVREIRATFCPQREIAVRYGICQMQVSYIKNNKRWKHVSELVSGT